MKAALRRGNDGYILFTATHIYVYASIGDMATQQWQHRRPLIRPQDNHFSSGHPWALQTPVAAECESNYGFSIYSGAYRCRGSFSYHQSNYDQILTESWTNFHQIGSNSDQVMLDCRSGIPFRILWRKKIKNIVHRGVKAAVVTNSTGKPWKNIFFAFTFSANVSYLASDIQ